VAEDAGIKSACHRSGCRALTKSRSCEARPSLAGLAAQCAPTMVAASPKHPAAFSLGLGNILASRGEGMPELTWPRMVAAFFLEERGHDRFPIHPDRGSAPPPPASMVARRRHPPRRLPRIRSLFDAAPRQALIDGLLFSPRTAVAPHRCGAAGQRPVPSFMSRVRSRRPLRPLVSRRQAPFRRPDLTFGRPILPGHGLGPKCRHRPRTLF